METNSKSYAVIFSYSFDNDVAVYLFDTYEEAFKFMKDNYEEELRIDTEENNLDSYGIIEKDEGWAKIYTRRHNVIDITTFQIGDVYE